MRTGQALRQRAADAAAWNDPETRARILEHQARRARRARILARYGHLIAEAVRRGELTHEEALDRIFTAQDKDI